MDWQDDEPAPVADDRGWVETCRIVLWRGYATAAFYAHAADQPPGAAVGEPSAAFRWRGRGTPETREARRAQLELVSRLNEDGWVEIGQGGEWYETELARAVFAPAARLAEPEPREAAPEPAPALAPAVHVPRPTARVDGWRVAAAAGLVAAIGLLGWVAIHPSAVSAVPPLPWPERVEQPLRGNGRPRVLDDARHLVPLHGALEANA